jgi:hypothetical protein
VAAALVAAGYSGSLDDMWDQHLAVLGITDTSEPFTDSIAIGGGGPTDPHFANVSLLVQAEDNALIDESSNGFTVTEGAFSSLSALNLTNINTVSNYLVPNNPGSGYYITNDGSGQFDLGADDWTFETWVYPTAIGAGDTLFSCIDFTGLHGYESAISGGQLLFRYYKTTETLVNVFSLGTPTLNAWQHVVFQRNGNTLEPFIDGVAQTTASLTGVTFEAVPTGQLFTVARDPAGTSGETFAGNYEQTRFTNGVARYDSGGFTPSTDPFPTS